MLAALLPVLGVAARYIALSPDPTLTPQVRLAAPWNEFIAAGAVDAALAVLTIAPVYAFYQWAEHNLLGPGQEVDRSLEAIRPRARGLDDEQREITQELDALERRGLALQASARDNPAGINPEEAEALKQSLAALQTKAQRWRTRYDEVEVELDQITTRITAIEKRIPLPARVALNLVQPAAPSVLPRPLAWLFSNGPILIFYLFVTPWWGAINSLAFILLVSRSLQTSVRTRSLSQIALATVALTAIAAVAAGLTPTLTRVVDADVSLDVRSTNRYLLLGETDTLAFLRPCTTSTEFLAVPWKNIESIRYEAVTRMTLDQVFFHDTPTAVALDLLRGKPVQVGQNTTNCD